MTVGVFPNSKFRFGLWLGAAITPLVWNSGAIAQPEASIVFNLRAQPLADTLTQIGRQTKSEIIFAAADVRGKTAPALNGSYSAEQALNQAVDSSSLNVKKTPQGVFLVQANPGESRPGEAIAGSAPANNESAALGDIVVTAQRKSENLQSIPLSVAAVTASSLQTAGTTDLRNLFLSVPALRGRSGIGGWDAYRIRGLGGGGTNIGDEPSVAIYVDGFYYPNTYTSTFSLANVERVEVLKGPQGTLFGRNSSAGVIQVVTSDPTYDFHLKGSASFENFARTNIAVYGSAGLSSNLALSLAGNYDRQAHGWGRNLTTGKDVNKSYSRSLRAKFLFEPADNFSIVTALDYSYQKTDRGIASSGIPGGIISLTVPTDPRSGLYDSQQNFDQNFRKSRSLGAQSTMKYDFGNAVITNRVQYRSINGFVGNDPDFGPRTVIHTATDRRDKILTEEIQLESNGSSSFQWVGGLFYMYLKTDNRPFGQHQFGSLTGGLDITDFRMQKINAAAAFFQGSYKFTDSTTFTAGIRYSKDWRDAEFVNYSIPGNPASAFVFTRNSGKQSKPAWRLALDQKFAQDMMAYVSYNRGFKSGPFDPNSPAGVARPSLKPETVDAYEIGIKTLWFDRKLKFNAAAFYNDFKNFQTNLITTDPTTGNIVVTPSNASGAKYKGFEIEIGAAPVDHLSLEFNLTYVDGKFKSYRGVPVSVKGPTGVGQNIFIDASGLPVPDNAPLTLSAKADYSIPISTGAFNLGAYYYYTSGNKVFQENPLTGTLTPTSTSAFVFPAVPELDIKGYDIVNLVVGYKPDSERWSARFYINNVTKSHPSLPGVFPYAFFRIPAIAPRVYGVTLGFNL